MVSENEDLKHVTLDVESEITVHAVGNPPPKTMIETIKESLKATLLPDDPFRHFKNKSPTRKTWLGIKYFLPILDWAPTYTLKLFKSDLIAGLTIASLAIPQGISYAKLANLPPIVGLYSSFVPPLIYALFATSRDLAVGNSAVGSLILGSMLAAEISPTKNPQLYLYMAFTATFFAGVFQALLGILRLGFLTDFLSHSTIVGFMSGCALVISLQQLKGILGLHVFTRSTDIISVLRSVFSQTDEWRWQSIVLGAIFLVLLVVAREISKRRPKLFWISAAAPLVSVIFSSLFVFLTHSEKHGIDIIGDLKKGLNPSSANQLILQKEYLTIAIKAGIIAGIIGIAEGIAVGRSFASVKKYEMDANKEMFAMGAMNIMGSCTSCYIVTGAFSRTAVNFNAGCKTVVSNLIMAVTVMFVLLFFIQVFYYTPLAILSVIILSAMFGLMDVKAFCQLWKVDKVDFLVCMGAFLGVVFVSVQVGLMIAVAASMLRVILHVARPKTAVLGNILGTTIYRSTKQYPEATTTPGILVFQVDSPIYFTNSGYIRERVMREVEEEELRLEKLKKHHLQYVILELSAVTCVDSTGVNMLYEMARSLEGKDIQLAMANPITDVMEKLGNSKFIEAIGQRWFFVNVSEAVEFCKTLM